MADIGGSREVGVNQLNVVSPDFADEAGHGLQPAEALHAAFHYRDAARAQCPGQPAAAGRYDLHVMVILLQEI
jgi:hypothetical protein